MTGQPRLLQGCFSNGSHSTNTVTQYRVKCSKESTGTKAVNPSEEESPCCRETVAGVFLLHPNPGSPQLHKDLCQHVTEMGTEAAESHVLSAQIAGQPEVPSGLQSQ